MKFLKQLARGVLPAQVLRWWRRHRHAALRRELAGLTPREAFTRIYSLGLWGRDPEGAYSSGTGSRDPAVTGPYVVAVRAWLASLPQKPVLADLGCGDFRVGAQLVDACREMIACDLVEPVIEDNRRRYAGSGAEFRVLDITSDELPAAEVVLLRQVLQHLPNAAIAKVLPRLQASYRYLVLTEQLPAQQAFRPNVDNHVVDDTRLAQRSGVVLTAAPFGLAVLEERVLCDVPDAEGRLVTTLYRLR